MDSKTTYGEQLCGRGCGDVSDFEHWWTGGGEILAGN